MLIPLTDLNLKNHINNMIIDYVDKLYNVYYNYVRANEYWIIKMSIVSYTL